MATRYESICHPIYLISAGGLNLPPLIFGLLGYSEWCKQFSSWLIGNAVLSGLNMIAAVYVVYKVRRMAQPSSIHDEGEDEPDIEKDEDDDDSNDTTEEMDDGDDVFDEPAPVRRKGCFSRLKSRSPSTDRIRHLLCYDGGITTYSIIFVFWIFWLSEGTQRLKNVESVEPTVLEGCFEYHETYVTTCLVCGFSYFCFVVVAVLASLVSR